MATAKARNRRAARTRTNRRLPRLLLALVALTAVLTFAFREPISGYAGLTAAYGARVGCSCHYVAGRPIGDCSNDLEPGMRLVLISADDEAGSVTATIPFLASETATWRRGWGCVLEEWEG